MVIGHKACLQWKYNLVDYLCYDAAEAINAGCLAWNATSEAMKRRSLADPIKPSCHVHRSGDYYWKHQQYGGISGTVFWRTPIHVVFDHDATG